MLRPAVADILRRRGFEHADVLVHSSRVKLEEVSVVALVVERNDDLDPIREHDDADAIVRTHLLERDLVVVRLGDLAALGQLEGNCHFALRFILGQGDVEAFAAALRH